MDRKAIWQVRGTSSAVFQRPTIRFVTRTHRTILCIYDRAPTDSPLGQKGSQIHSNEDPNKGKLRLFLDSASLQLWEHWASSRLFYGITTNPTILQKDAVACNVPVLTALAQEAIRLGAQEVQMQAWGGSAGRLYSVGLDLAAIDARIVVKLPITAAGVEATGLLKAKNVRTTLTGVYAAHQAFTAIAAGADYAAPYLGRMNDAGKDGRAEILAMQDMIYGLESNMRLLVASVRSTEDIVALASQGCNTFTISPACAEQLFSESLTDRAAEQFEQDARSNSGS